MKSRSMCRPAANLIAAAGLALSFAAWGAHGVDPALPAYTPHPVAAPKDAGYVLADGSIRIVGTEVIAEALERLDTRFAELHPGIKFATSLKGTSAAIPALTFGVSAFAPMGRHVIWVENVPYSKIVGAAPLEIRVAHGAVSGGKKANVLAIYVNKANPLDRLTTEQAARIFAAGHAKGDLTQWSQLGVKGELGRQPIHTYGATDDGGFGQYILDYQLHGLRFRRGHERLPDSAQIVQRIGDDSAGIGFAALGFATPEVKVVAIAPSETDPYSSGTAEDVGAGRYPYNRYMYFYVRREPGKPVDAFVKEYMRFVLSKEGQQIIAAENDGYVPLNAREAAAELSKLD
jgi:phosphate transport system substrate-binding protein